MSRKDYRGFLATVGEQLRQDALEHVRTMKQEPLDQGILMGYAFALDTMWDHLKTFHLASDDLNWRGFTPERDLLGGLATRER